MAEKTTKTTSWAALLKKQEPKSVVHVNTMSFILATNINYHSIFFAYKKYV